MDDDLWMITGERSSLICSHQFKVSNGDSIFTEKLKYCAINDKVNHLEFFVAISITGLVLLIIVSYCKRASANNVLCRIEKVMLLIIEKLIIMQPQAMKEHALLREEMAYQ
ncbi:50S ribosomal protein L21, mitochondrial [Linum perenne]